jgi:hypothetical protein
VSKSQFEVRSGELGGALAVHCSGGLAAGGEWGHVDHALVRGRGCACAAEVASLFDLFDSAGLQYGPAYRTLVQAWGDNARGTSRLRTRSAWQGTQVHPADLDDGLCTSALARSGIGGDGETRLPFAVDRALLQGGMGTLWAVRRFRHELHCPVLYTGVLTVACACAVAGYYSGECRGGVGAFGFAPWTAAGAAGWLQVARIASQSISASGSVCK